jgi:protein-S-isoprenylcysteine O-methyltransferase Ste14
LRLPFTYATAILTIALATNRLYFPALVLVASGMAIRIWAAGHVVKRRTLFKSGPYAYVRNPLYLGTLVGTAGIIILIQNWWLMGAFLAGFAVIYGSTIRSEEDFLLDQFGEEFLDYKKTVPALIPRLIPTPSVSESRFTWRDVARNHEHLSILWSLLVILAVFIRAYMIR